jgi:N4-(beta-N-acetylglucosaminyl)-L-asparaginase
MANRRDFLKLSALTATLLTINKSKAANLIADADKKSIKPIVISTWRFGVEANAAAWKILSANGRCLDAALKFRKEIQKNAVLA